MNERFDPYEEWLGILPHEHPVDHYRLLGLDKFESDRHQIEQAADQRMLQLRRLQSGPRGKHSQQLLNEVSQARVALLDPAAKAAYDEMLQALLATDEMPPTGAMQPGSDWEPAAAAAPPVSETPPPRIGAPHQAGSVTRRLAQIRKPLYAQAWFLCLSFFSAAFVIGAVWYLQQQIPDQPNSSSGGNSNHGKFRVGPPIVPEDAAGTIRQASNGSVAFPIAQAELHGGALKRSGEDGAIAGWRSLDDWISWNFRVERLPRSGMFRVLITYTADSADNQFVVQIDQREKNFITRKATEYVTDEDFLFVPKTGAHTLSIRGRVKNGEELMVLKGIELQFPDNNM